MSVIPGAGPHNGYVNGPGIFAGGPMMSRPLTREEIEAMDGGETMAATPSRAKRVSADDINAEMNALREERDYAKQRQEEEYAKRTELRVQVTALQEEIATTRAQFADLKQRLSDAEMVNQQMRGYIMRVQEDDITREELVKVGDPNGEMQLVPKRKHATFPTPDQFGEGGEQEHRTVRPWDGFDDSIHRKRMHWVKY